MKSYQKIGIVGGGAWGTALAVAAIHAGKQALLYTRSSANAESINSLHKNQRYLPDILLPEKVQATCALDDLAEMDALLIVVPTQQIRIVVEDILAFWPSDKPLVLCAKGIEQTTGFLSSQVVYALQPKQALAVLSGPSFAVDVARGKPTAACLAGSDMQFTEELCQALSSSRFRLYASDDIVGVGIGGALKNVIAICCGITAGRDLGLSAQAALMTRGFSEMVRYGAAYGAEAKTFMGLSGLGDLVLSCTSAQSRNFAFGAALGAHQAEAGQPYHKQSPLAEGVFTAKIAAKNADDKTIDLPILRTVSEVLAQQISIDEAIEGLLQRPLRAE